MQVKKQGFAVIDAVDGSIEMLNIAKELGIYRHLFCSVVGERKIDAIDDGKFEANFVPCRSKNPERFVLFFYL